MHEGDTRAQKPIHSTGGSSSTSHTVMGTISSPRQGTDAQPVSPTAAVLPQPKSTLEALEQRMSKYKEAYAQARANGDDRKARMHA